jgi:magnesium and cobalt transporter
MAPTSAAFRIGVMGDSHDGSPPAAHRAQETEPDSTARGSFLGRLFGWDGDGGRNGHRLEDPALHGLVVRSRSGSSSGVDTGEGLIVDLGKLVGLKIDDVAVPRADIVAVPVDADLSDVVRVFRESENTRLPVYEETLDQPIGLVHLKDLALLYGFGAGGADFDLRSIVRPLLYVPHSMPLGTLLTKMQATRTHMALVIDEYGGVDGLVTIEDILEEIVGEIDDEHDREESRLWSREASGVYLLNARLDLEAFAAEAGIDLDVPDLTDEVDTLGGLVTQLAGRVPERGEVVLHPQGHEFEVVDADARRIKRLRLRLAEAGTAVGRAAE